MRFALLKLFIIAGHFMVAGCLYPVSPSPACQARVSECLKSCDPTESEPPVGAGTETVQDRRSQCEKNCHQRCNLKGQ